MEEVIENQFLCRRNMESATWCMRVCNGLICQNRSSYQTKNNYSLFTSQCKQIAIRCTLWIHRMYQSNKILILSSRGMEKKKEERNHVWSLFLQMRCVPLLLAFLFVLQENGICKQWTCYDRNVNAASSTSLICTVRVEIYYSFDSFSDKREVISIRNNLVIGREELTSFTQSLSPSAAEISDCHRFWWFLLASGLICLPLLVSRWQIAWTRKESTDVPTGTCTTATMQAHGHAVCAGSMFHKQWRWTHFQLSLIGDDLK